MPGRKRRRAAIRPDRRLVLAVAAAVLIVGVCMLLGTLRSGIVGVFHGRLAAEPTHLVADSPPFSVYFEPDSATLEPGAIATLQPIAQHAWNQHLEVSITGYASAVGPAASSHVLSLQRADAGRAKLIAFGVPAAQITHVGGADATDLASALASEASCAGNNPAEATCPDQRRAVIILFSATDSP